MDTIECDVLVVGGGINGAGIARDAVVRRVDEFHELGRFLIEQRVGALRIR